MSILFKNMIKEEWRIHSTLFGSFLFILFPLLIFLIVLATYFAGPFLLSLFSMTNLLLSIHLLFFFFGLNIGAFGLHGTEFMNRRFGHASLLAYSSRSLPISEKVIFTNVIFKDIVYYFFLIVLPSTMGLSAVGLFYGITLFQAFILLISITLSFFLGIAIVFFFSTLYAHSGKLLLFFLFILAVALAIISKVFSVYWLFPPFEFFKSHSLCALLWSVVLIKVPFIYSIFFLKIDFPSWKPEFTNRMPKLTEFFKKIYHESKYAVLTAKDFLDLMRSRGGIGRIIFSLLLPVGMIWIFVYYFAKYLPIVDMLAVFSIFLGIYTPSIYNWLTEFDAFTNYSFLPVTASEVIKSKVRVTFIISIMSIIIFIAAAFFESNIALIIPGLICYMCMFIYGLAMTIYLTGLNPNIMFFNPKILVKYLLCITPIGALFLVMSVFSPYSLLFSLLLLPIAYLVFRKSYKKWDNTEQLVY